MNYWFYKILDHKKDLSEEAQHDLHVKDYKHSFEYTWSHSDRGLKVSCTRRGQSGQMGSESQQAEQEVQEQMPQAWMKWVPCHWL